MKPSNVVLFVPPLVGTFGSSEREGAAALMVRACQVRGDEWAPVTWEEIVDVMRGDCSAGVEFGRLILNPFFRPDVHSLIAEGFARWTSDVGGSVEFTEKGLATLAASRWVQS